MTGPTRAADPELAGFLALLATRRSPRTVEAYRRDLADATASPALGGTRPGAATSEQLQAYVAALAAHGLSPRGGEAIKACAAFKIRLSRPAERPLPKRPVIESEISEAGANVRWSLASAKAMRLSSAW